jgi:hypothetical protein
MGHEQRVIPAVVPHWTNCKITSGVADYLNGRASWRPITQPATAPTFPCPAICPAKPPTTAPLMQPFALAVEGNTVVRMPALMRNRFIPVLLILRTITPAISVPLRRVYHHVDGGRRDIAILPSRHDGRTHTHGTCGSDFRNSPTFGFESGTGHKRAG